MLRLVDIHVFEINQKVVVSFRPEETKLNHKLKGDYSLQGKIIDKRFVQGRLYFLLQLENRQLVKASLAPSSHNAARKPGEVLSIRIDPDNVLLYPYPSEGLKKKLQIF